MSLSKRKMTERYYACYKEIIEASDMYKDGRKGDLYVLITGVEDPRISLVGYHKYVGEVAKVDGTIETGLHPLFQVYFSDGKSMTHTFYTCSKIVQK